MCLVERSVTTSIISGLISEPFVCSWSSAINLSPCCTSLCLIILRVSTAPKHSSILPRLFVHVYWFPLFCLFVIHVPETLAMIAEWSKVLLWSGPAQLQTLTLPLAYMNTTLDRSAMGSSWGGIAAIQLRVGKCCAVKSEFTRVKWISFIHNN